MGRVRQWAKLDWDWYTNKKVRRVTREYGPVAGAYWAMLIAKAKHASHVEVNPTGIIETTMQTLADELYDKHDRTPMWGAFIKAGLVRVTGGKWRDDYDTVIHIELVDFCGHQNPTGSPADRKEKSRDLQGSVTTGHKSSQNVTKRERKRESKRDTLTLSYPTGSDSQNVETVGQLTNRIVKEAYDVHKQREGSPPLWSFVGARQVVERFIRDERATVDELRTALAGATAVNQNTLAVAISKQRGKDPFAETKRPSTASSSNAKYDEISEDVSW